MIRKLSTVTSWFFFGIFALFFSLLLLYRVRTDATSEDEYVFEKFSPIAQVEVKWTDEGVRYTVLNRDKPRTMLMIHGAPGDSGYWFNILNHAPRILEDYKILIPDRPGYSGSRSFGPITSIEEQADLIDDIIENEIKVDLIAHSYGAPIALYIASKNPGKIDQIIAISGQYNPENEVSFFFTNWIDNKIFKVFLPRHLWTSNREKVDHVATLNKSLNIITDMKNPILLVHGTKDSIVKYENSTWLKGLLPNAKLIDLPEVNHPVHYTHPKEIAQIMTEYFINGFVKQPLAIRSE